MTDFSEMQFDLGGNIFAYNHTTAFNLPDPSHGQSMGSNWSGDLDLYVKCQDTHGIETPNYYVIKMCVNQGPDKTPPKIKLTEPENDALLPFALTEKSIKIITNEFSECKWSYVDKSYESMENSFICNDTLQTPSSPFGYVCQSVVPSSSVENKFFIRCSDQPWLNDTSLRNSNSESFVYTINKPEKQIVIEEILPNSDFKSSFPYTTINLQVTTSGGGASHICAYSFSNYDKMIEFFETSSNVHKQPLNVPSKENHIYIECRDETGDFARSETTFTINYDDSSPLISRIWKSGNVINFVTNEPAECIESVDNCLFPVNNSASLTTDHSFDALAGKTYYIKCIDEFGNAPASCTMIINSAGK